MFSKSWAAWGLAANLLILMPLAAFAQNALSVYASPSYEYNSNVFYLPSGTPVPGTTDTRHGDGYVVYRGGLNEDYQLSEQDFFIRLGAADYKYQHFTQLNRDEYQVDGGWRWWLSRDLTGGFDVSRSRSMLPFSYLLQEQDTPVLQTTQKEAATVKYQFNPDWRIDGSLSENKTTSPVPAAALLNLKETSVSTTLTYTENVRLTGGGRVTFVNGRYQDGVINLAPTYHEFELAGVANYAAKGLSSFSGALGYTRRDSSSGINSVSSVTGSLEYKRALTGKTSMDLSLTRAVNSDITNTGSEVDTTAAGSLNWQATYKIGVALGYSWTQRFLPGQNASPTAQVAIGSDRTDHQQYAFLNVDYQVLRWLVVRPYANYQTRSSNALDGTFNATIVGIVATGTFGKGAAKN
jgi:hypothetical protein